MASKAQAAGLKVILHQRVIVDDGRSFDAERQVFLPIQPFAGMYLYNTDWAPPGCDDPEERIEEVACDLKTGRMYCFLPLRDFRPESSGCEWPEEDILETYQDWKLTWDSREKKPAKKEKARRAK
jgi:hypothetical protein